MLSQKELDAYVSLARAEGRVPDGTSPPSPGRVQEIKSWNAAALLSRAASQARRWSSRMTGTPGAGPGSAAPRSRAS